MNSDLKYSAEEARKEFRKTTTKATEAVTAALTEAVKIMQLEEERIKQMMVRKIQFDCETFTVSDFSLIQEEYFASKTNGTQIPNLQCTQKNLMLNLVYSFMTVSFCMAFYILGKYFLCKRVR